MGTKSAKQVDFERLAGALDGYRFAYLVTVDDDYRVVSGSDVAGGAANRLEPDPTLPRRPVA